MKIHTNLCSPEGVSSGSSGASTPISVPGGDPTAASIFENGSATSGDVANQNAGQAEKTPPTVPVSSGSTKTPPTSDAAAGAAGQQTSPTPAGTPQQPPQAQQGLTPQQMADIAAQAAAKVVAPTQQQTQQPEFTQADFNKAFNIPTVDAAAFQAITGYAPDKPEQVQALNNFAQSIIRAAVTMSNFQLEQARQQVTAQMSPVLQAQKQQVDAQLENEFFTAHGHLKDFRPLVGEIAKGIIRDGKQFNSKEELFKAVADQASLLLGRAMPQQQNGGTPLQNTPNGQIPTANGSQHPMTPAGLATGGQVSSGSRSATGANDAKTIFG